jgi:hypothetical protein
MSWKILRESKRPVGSVGRMFERRKLARAVSNIFVPLVYVPGAREIVLHRIVYVLERS